MAAATRSASPAAPASSSLAAVSSSRAFSAGPRTPSSVTRDRSARTERSGRRSCGATSTCQASRRLSASRAITAKTSATSPNPAEGSASSAAAISPASRVPSHARMTAASACVSGTGGVSASAQQRAVDAHERHPPRHEPGAQRAGVVGHDRAHRPALQVGDAGGQRESRCGVVDADAAAIVDLRPAHRPEEADAVVLRAVALQVARDERLVPPVLGVALRWLRARDATSTSMPVVSAWRFCQATASRSAGRPATSCRAADRRRTAAVNSAA